MTQPDFEWGDRLPTLIGDGVTLRWLTEDDAGALYAVFSDPSVMRFWSRPPFASIADAKALVDDIHAGFRSRSLFQWGITAASGGPVIGTCTLYQWSRAHKRAEIGFALGKAHWGKGYARKAVSRVIELGFDTLGLHRIEADADPRNDRSLGLLEGLGFSREGLLRERYHLGGEIQDALMLGLLEPEWRARQKAT